MKEAHDRAVEILSSRRDQMDLMAQVLLERETVDGEECEALLENDWAAYLEREKRKEEEGSSALESSEAPAKPVSDPDSPADPEAPAAPQVPLAPQAPPAVQQPDEGSAADDADRR